MRTYVHTLRQIHRWLAIAVSPFLFLIIVSGMILAFQPILAVSPEGGSTPAGLLAALQQADPAGRATSLAFVENGRAFELGSRHNGPAGRFDAVTGVQTGPAGSGFYAFARRLHEGLLVHAKWLVTAVTVMTVFLIVSGLLLGWRRLRMSWRGWHAGLGWMALPLVALTPLSGMLLALHIGNGGIAAQGGGRPLDLAAAIEIASHETDVSHLLSARAIHRGAVVLTLREGVSTVQYVVSDRGGVQRNPGQGWIRAIHAGTWAGAWSGIFTLISVLPLLGLLVTGLVPWIRRSRAGTTGGHQNIRTMAGGI